MNWFVGGPGRVAGWKSSFRSSVRDEELQRMATLPSGKPKPRKRRKPRWYDRILDVFLER